MNIKEAVRIALIAEAIDSLSQHTDKPIDDILDALNFNNVINEAEAMAVIAYITNEDDL